MNKTEAVYNWLKSYDGFNNLYFNFSIDKNNTSVMIPSPSDYLLYEDISGVMLRNYIFSVSHFKHLTYLPNKENIDNMEEVQKFLDWIYNQNKIHNYPEFPESCNIDYIKNINNIPKLSKTNNNLVMFYTQIQIQYTEK